MDNDVLSYRQIAENYETICYRTANFDILRC